MTRFQLIPPGDTVTVTTTYKSVFADVLGDFAASLNAASVGGSTPTFDVIVEESPDGPEVTDANAIWHTLITFTQVTADAKEKKEVTTPHYSRLRAKVTVGGTSPTANLSLKAEGVTV